MSDLDPNDLPGGPEAQAAEYVLGLLPADEHAAFEALLAHDPDLEQDVAAWAAYFSTFTDPIPEVAPPQQVWRRIEVAAYGAQKKPSIWRLVMPYVSGAVLGAAVTWAVYSSNMLTPSAPMLLADLAPVEGQITLAARFDPGTGVLAVDQLQGEAPEGRVLELWLIAEADSAPISLGLLSATGGTVLAVPQLLAERMAGATLAVSDEPLGGSPTGAPTGAVRAAGRLG